MRPAPRSSCTRRSPRAGTRSRPSPSARRRGSRRRPASRGGSSPPARSARPARDGARRRSGPRPTRSPRGRRSAGSFPARWSSATRSGSTSIARTVPSAEHGVGQLVRLAARAARAASCAPRSRAELRTRDRRRARRRCASRARGTRSAPARSPTGRCSASTSSPACSTPTRRAGSSASRPASACRRSRASCTRAGWRCRTSATSTPSRWPARSPPARTAPARASRTSPGRSRASSSSSPTAASGRSTAATCCAPRGSSLGALGVIAAVTIRCVPAFRLRNTDQPEPLEDVLDSAPGARRRPRPLRVLDVPARRRRAHPHARPHRGRRRRRPGRARAYTSDVLLDNHAFRAINEVARRFPRTIPRLNRFASAVASQRERVDWSLRDLRLRAARALRGDGVRAAARARGRRRCAPPARCSSATRSSFPIELRFSAADDALLSPAHGRAVDVRRRARVPRDGLRAGVPRGRGGAVASSAAARTGASARSSPPPSWPRATRAGTPSRPSARELDPDGRFANAWVRDVLG